MGEGGAKRRSGIQSLAARQPFIRLDGCAHDSLSHKASGEVRRRYIPPILQTIFHSSAVTGCTDSREYFTSAMSASFLSALIAAIVTGVFSGLSALMSTQTNLPVLSVGSG